MSASSESIRTLMEIGIAAAGAGLFRQAFQIFEGVEAMRPESEGPSIGVALIHMNSGAPEEAVKVLREGALVRNPNSLEAKMILGLALKLARRASECDHIIKELTESGDAKAESFAKQLAAR
jgi:hypothetical protein